MPQQARMRYVGDFAFGAPKPSGQRDDELGIETYWDFLLFSV